MSAQAGTLEQTTTMPSLDTEPECTHSEHGTKPARHTGPATWAVTNTCRGCNTTFQGLRCDQWRTWLLTTRGTVQCIICGHTQLTYDHYRDTHWRKL